MKHDITQRPSVQELEAELSRVKYQRRYQTVLKSTVYTLITVAAVAVLVATLWLPVLQIYGSSMAPTLQDGEIIFSVKTGSFERGDIIIIRSWSNGSLRTPVTGWISKKTAPSLSTMKSLASLIWRKSPSAMRTLNCPIRCPTVRCLSWATTVPPLPIPGTQPWAVWLRNRSWEEFSSGSGPWIRWA